MRRQIIDVSRLKLHPSQERYRKRLRELRELRATVTDQALARQMAEQDDRAERCEEADQADSP
jgi:hypothetical protein